MLACSAFIFGVRVSVTFHLTCVHSISSPEPLGSQDELIVYPSSRRPYVVRPPFSKIFFSETAWPNSMWSPLGKGNKSFYKWSRSHDQDGRHAHIW